MMVIKLFAAPIFERENSCPPVSEATCTVINGIWNGLRNVLENSAFANFCQNPINVHLKMIAVVNFALKKQEKTAKFSILSELEGF